MNPTKTGGELMFPLSVCGSCYPKFGSIIIKENTILATGIVFFFIV